MDMQYLFGHKKGAKPARPWWCFECPSEAMSINNSIALHPIKWNWCFFYHFPRPRSRSRQACVQRCSKLQLLQFWPPHLRIVLYWIYITFDFYFSSICIVHWIHALYIVHRAAQMFHKPVSTLFLSWVIPQTLWMINNPFIHQFHYGMFILGSNAAFVSIGRFFYNNPILSPDTWNP